MSLKAFHVVFITAASALCFGFGVWLLHDYRSMEGTGGELWMGIASMAVGLGLLVYEGFFLKKLKNVSFL